MKVLLTSLLVLGIAALFGRSPEEPCCTVAIAITPESPADLVVTITNSRVPLVDVVVARAESDFKILLTNDKGEEVSRTEYGKRLLTEGYEGSRRHTQLNRGQPVTQKLELQRVFDLTSGSFNVTLLREVLVGGGKVQLRGTATVHVP